MPRLRHRMRCRRGSTRSHPQRAPSTSNSESSPPSSEYFAGRYSDTRSGRRRSHSASFRMASTALVTPASLASNPPQTTQFYLNYTLNRPRIIATILVSFREEPQLVEASTHSGGKATESALDVATKSLQVDKHKGKTPIDEEKDSRRSEHSAPFQVDKPKDEDDMEAYRCLILEEPPPHHAN